MWCLIPPFTGCEEENYWSLNGGVGKFGFLIREKIIGLGRRDYIWKKKQA